MNPYLYCGGDPVNHVDPSGMLGEEIPWFTAGGVSMSAAGVVLFGTVLSWGTVLVAAGVVGLAWAGIRTAARWTAYQGVKDDFARNIRACEIGKDQALATNPAGDEYQMWCDIETEITDDQKEIVGPFLWDLFNLGNDVSRGG